MNRTRVTASVLTAMALIVVTAQPPLSKPMTDRANSVYSLSDRSVDSSSGHFKSSSIGLSAQPQQTGTSQKTTVEAPEEIVQFKLMTTDAGWAATSDRLFWTKDKGKNWNDISPPALDGAKILGVHFLSELQGSVVAMRSANSPIIETTSDGGKTWLEQPLSVSTEATGTFIISATPYFVDGSHGWLMLRLASSSNFSRGLLLRTVDGGQSWNQMPDPPIGDPVMFSSATEGWIAGGARGDALYVTRDGGEHWTQQSVSPPPDQPYERISLSLPFFRNPTEGTLPVVFTDGENSQLFFYTTTDEGRTWLPGKQPSSVIGGGRSPAYSVLESGAVVAESPQPRVLSVFSKDGTLRSKNSLRNLPENANVIRIDFNSESSGWILVAISKCEEFKSNCKHETRLFTSLDDGQSLVEITPPRQVLQPLPKGFGAQLGEAVLSDEITAKSVVTSQNKEGFDKCEIATTNQMQTWFNSSPYRAVGFYIGGVSRSCGNAGLSTTWVNTVAGMGWGLIPIWVGPQAPNSGFSNRISFNATTADSQGVAEADAASDRAAAIGLSAPTIIYYDMEAYNRGDSSARTAVQSFINGWVRRLHQRGNTAAVYSSHPEFQDWSNLTNTPDAIWFAWFFQNGVACGNLCHTVFGVPDISDTLWNNHQRIRQTSSTIDRCWGSVCFTGNGGIDEDWLDGPVASPGSSCTTSVGSGTSGSELTAFQNAYSNGGGQSALGCATAGVRFDGFTSFAGTVGHFQTFVNGDIEYLSNGSRAGQAYALNSAFSTKWGSFGFTSSNPLGYPIGNRTTGSSSCAGTSNDFQSFEGGSLTRHLSGSRSGSIFEVHGAIHSKWSLKGFSNCPLGLPISDERNATTSAATGKTGRVNDFERGHIHWWTNAAQAFETHGAIDSVYTGMGGTGSFLGFPISDEYIDTTGFARSDFEGGYITTLDGINYQAFHYGCNGPGSFSLNAPANGQSLVSTTSVTLTWGSSANANSYDVYFGTSSNPPFLANQTSTSRTVTVTPGQTYFWKVVAKVSCGSSTTTAGVWSFTVQTCNSPGTFSLTSPSNGQVLPTTTSVTLSWGSSANANSYDVYFGASSNPPFVANQSGTNRTVPVTAGQTYFWKVVAKVNCGSATTTAGVWSFSVQSDCIYHLSSIDNTVGPGTGSTNFQMDTTSGCSWAAVSDSPSWLTTSSSGTGAGQIRYDFASNNSTSSRTGHITAGGQVHTVTQIGIGGAGNVRFSTSSYAANEGGGTATITVTRSTGTGSGNISYATSGGTATPNTDYIPASGILIFPENVTSRTFDVTILDDSVFEGTESINLVLSTPSTSLTLGTPSSATLTISDNDTSPTPTNYALAANGSSVTASSTLSTFAASNVIDGSRRALNNTLWLDNTYNSFGDWVEVNFNGSKTISEIDVVTQQDDPNNLVEPTLTQTFGLYGVTAFDVQYWNGSAWTTVPGGSVTGNNKVWRQFTFTPITTTKIRVLVNGGADNAFSRLVEIEAWSGTPPTPANPTNYALAANGGSVTASSTLSPFAAGNVIDGSRRALNNTLWLDNTFNSFGDWVEVNFNGSKTISEIDVVTQQDDPNNLVEPTLTQTFGLYGVTAFDVQYWNGSAWTTVPGGSVTGNNKVWRQFTFTPITTTKIRVLVNGGADNAFSRLVEIEAWSGTSPTLTNYARATNGGSVTASSTLSPFVAGNVIDGSRRALNNTLWLDNTFNSFGDWVEVNFNGSKTISEIDVVTQQDDPNNPLEPTLTQTFGLYGVTAFDVQYWNGSAWTTVPGGSVTGNNKVWRQFTFTPITTTKIRVLVNGGADNAFSRLTEVEAWGPVGP